MAYLTVADLEPGMIFVDRDDEDDYSPRVMANQRSFAHHIPLRRVARRKPLHDELSVPLQDHLSLGMPCPVIDTEALGEARLKELREFLPKHLFLRTDANGETFIVSVFEELERAYEKTFELICKNEKRKKRRKGYCAWEHDWCDWSGYVGMTSAQALRKERDENNNGYMYSYNCAPELAGTDYWMFGKSNHFVTIWQWVSKCGQGWAFDVHHDAAVPVQLNEKNKIMLRLYNHRVPSLKPEKFGSDEDHPPRTIGDLAQWHMDKEHETNSARRYWNYSPDGDPHEPFYRRCTQTWARGFLGRLRLEGSASRQRGVKRNLTVVEHDFAHFNPEMRCKAENSDWMVFGLSLARGVPSLYSIPPEEHTQYGAVFDKPLQRAYVHHSGGLWRVLFLVPNVYWTSPVRRYQMGTYIANILEDRDCGLNAPFPVSRGLDAVDKALIEQTPYMSSAIQHALYNLQYLLKVWDRDHTVELDPFNPSYSLMMPTEELPHRMQPCKKDRHYQGKWQGTITQFQRMLCGSGVDTSWEPPISDLWKRSDATAQMQRVARSVSVDDEQTFLDVAAVPVRRRVLRLD